MNTKHNFSFYILLVSLAGVALITTACSSPTSAPTPIVAKPTLAPTNPLPTNSPTLPKPTATSTVAPTSAPTATPTHPVPTSTPTIAPTATPTEAILPIGEVQTVNDVSFLPQKIEFMALSGSNKPKTGDQYLLVTFSIENKSKTASFDFNPDNIVILNPTGMAISMVTLKSQTNELAAQMLKPGEKLEGVIVYEVPQKENKWTLEFKTTNNQNLMWSIG